MKSKLSGAWRFFMRRAENLSALFMGLMFVSFLVQVAARYVFNNPVAWADELSVIMGIWVILWTTSFVTRESDNIRFDMIYSSVSPGVRRVFDAVSGLIFFAIFAVGFPAAVSYVMFMKVESTAALGLRYDLVFSVYVIFAAAMIVRHGWIVWCAIKGRPAFRDPSAAELPQ